MMYTTDEIKKVMEPVEEMPKIGFIDRKQPDKKAAAQRYYWAEDMLYDWHSKLNDRSSNTREMPKELLELYDQACNVIMQICDYEKRLSE